MTGAIPLYLCPERNELGIIGPIPLSEFSPESIRAKIDASPLTRGRPPKVKLAVVTNSTYDGLCYNAELIKQQLGSSVEVLHFDEALVRLRRLSRVLSPGAMAWAPRARRTAPWCSPTTVRINCLPHSARRR